MKTSGSWWSRRSSLTKRSRLPYLAAFVVVGGIGYVLLGTRPVGDPVDARLRAQLARTGAKQLLDAVRLYRVDHGRLPASLDDLLHPPPVAGRAKSYVNSRDNLHDPWKHLYELRALGNAEFAIQCYGGDGKPGGEGDDGDFVVESHESTIR